jgi:hypothetical protein
MLKYYAAPGLPAAYSKCAADSIANLRSGQLATVLAQHRAGAPALGMLEINFVLQQLLCSRSISHRLIMSMIRISQSSQSVGAPEQYC